jgi:uncharacterized delta-60 repeat protein
MEVTMSGFRCAPVLLCGLMTFIVIGCGGGSGSGSAASVPGAGALDSTFGTGGRVLSDIGVGPSDEAYAMAIQPSDGKIVVVGGDSQDFALARYTLDGVLDPTFGSFGKVLTDFSGDADYALSVAIQPGDGKIVVAGQVKDAGNWKFGLARYNPDGSLDDSFGTFGKAMTVLGGGNYSGANAVAIQANGRIVVAGFGWDASPTPHQYVAIARYLGNGTLDGDWNVGGIVLTDVDGLLGGSEWKSSATAVAVQPDGKVVITGWAHGSSLSQLVIARYDNVGVLDPGFSGDGLVANRIETTAAGTSLALLSGGKILAAGGTQTAAGARFALTQYLANGAPDTSFGTNGVVTTAFGTIYDQAYGLAVQPDGKIVLAGYSNDGAKNNFALARYGSSGALDPTFGVGGKVVTTVGSGSSKAYGVGIQSDGRIVAAGTAVGAGTDFALIRLWP